MGSNTSSEAAVSKVSNAGKRASTSSVLNEKEEAYQDDDEFISELRGLQLGDATEDPINVESLKSWEADFLGDVKNRLTQRAFARTDITQIVQASDTKHYLTDRYLFNLEIKSVGSPSCLNNQKSSGRCWIFAASNVLRTQVIRNFNLPEDSFQLSQSYLYFYDKLEKANLFLENVIDTADEVLDSRLIQFLLKDPVGDGGQWDMIVNLVEKYGVVPNEVFPDNFQSTNSSRLNYLVTEKLREHALILRDVIAKGAPKITIYALKNSMVKQVFNIISLALGTPPKPTDSFQWEFTDKNNSTKSLNTSPKDFYSNFVKLDASSYFSLIHDPRNETDQLYTVDRLNNIYGGKPIEYVNTSLNDIKQVAIKMLKADEPIFFGSDVGKFYDRNSGVLDTGAYDYELALGTALNISKSDRLKTGSSQMTHAMVITGVHLDPNTSKPVRWKIENSWGSEVGDKGFFMMTDAWFDEYVFQIVTSKKFVTKKTYDVWAKKDFKVLPFYDPMGSLA